jgi:hypothetical protein
MTTISEIHPEWEEPYNAGYAMALAYVKELAETGYIIVAGNLSDGFTFHGPFADFDELQAYAEAHRIEEYWGATLHRPKQAWIQDYRKPTTPSEASA